MQKDKRSITFLLPSVCHVPSGGFKIVYEYANRLYKRGYKVNLIHPKKINKARTLDKMLSDYLKYLKSKVNEEYHTGSWFPIEKGIINCFVPYVSDKYIPDADVIFATGWETAKPVLNLDISKGRKCYFIQSLEIWAGPEKDVIETWKFSLEKIVISKWLYEFAESIKEEAEYIPNGLDYSKFDMDILPENRSPKNILMLVSNSDVKGSKYGIAAISKLKELVPDIDVTFFGVDNLYEQPPEWVKLYRNPSQNQLRSLYNSASIFLSPSLLEGFPLPPAEAMMCGTTLVASDIGGHREYAVNGRNSLLFPPKDVDKNVDCLLTLIKNQGMRCKYGYNGYNDIRKYDWEKSVNMFEKFIINCI